VCERLLMVNSVDIGRVIRPSTVNLVGRQFRLSNYSPQWGASG
jgi:hypothetical protein